MNWKYVLVGMIPTLLAALIQAGIVHAIPIDNDDEYVPPWLVVLILGTVASLAFGWWG